MIKKILPALIVIIASCLLRSYYHIKKWAKENVKVRDMKSKIGPFEPIIFIPIQVQRL